MPQATLSTTLAPRAVTRPRCPQCQAPALVQRKSPGRTGFEHWTLRCPKCGTIHEAQVQVDPMKSESAGWLSGDLHAPT
jgi:ssDNA-binding Zn-finger/Zn-ribbon topoisomerase 1